MTDRAEETIAGLERWMEEASERLRASEERARKAEEEAYELKYAIAGGEDVPGSANAVTVDDVKRWDGERRAILSAAEARVKELEACLQMVLDEDAAVWHPLVRAALGEKP